jgi:hypothetical protein
MPIQEIAEDDDRPVMSVAGPRPHITRMFPRRSLPVKQMAAGVTVGLTVTGGILWCW